MLLSIPVQGWLHVPYSELHPVFVAVAAVSCPSSQVAAILTGKMGNTRLNMHVYISGIH